MLSQIGVRQLVEFLFRSGDLNVAAGSDNSMQAGSRIHRKIQKSWPATYQAEVALSTTIDYYDDQYVISGRADGIDTATDTPLIEEIKTSDVLFAELPAGTLNLYWAQAKVYAYMYLAEHPATDITLQLTYVQTPNEVTTVTRQKLTNEEVQQFFTKLVTEYQKWLKLRRELNANRVRTAQALQFPFDHYRKGQHELAVSTYKSILLEIPLLVEAPTGTGKTISTLFPAIKALGEQLIARIFYLTAKQSTRRVAEQALTLMTERGLNLKAITLTAKDKISLPEEADLAPEDNPYMVGYYDRIRPAIMDIVEHETLITRETVQQYARKHMVDPFEYSLDVSLFCDVITCDYNYLFDPQVHLQRFFTVPDKNNCFLVDEAHNLVKRSRQMYSAEITSTPIWPLINQLNEAPGDNQALIKALKAFKRAFRKYGRSARESDEHQLFQTADVPNFNKAVVKFIDAVADWLPKQDGESDWQTLLDYYFNCRRYQLISTFYQPEKYQTQVSYVDKQYRFRQICLDPSEQIADSLALGRSAILFSATLSPLTYYQRLFGLADHSGVQALPSPFDSQRQRVIIASQIQTTYKNRPNSIPQICDTINTMVKAKPGNYLIFFPSFKYLDEVATAFANQFPHLQLIRQTPAMSDDQRQAFLDAFSDTKTPKVGFALLGGLFSEGIDLRGTQLIGVGIVGVGLPQLNAETNLLRDYFDEQVGDGFAYAYQLPGFNNVAQAVGRLIRTETDGGIVVLMDQRFNAPRYQRLFPKHWSQISRTINNSQLANQLTDFWRGFTNKK
ncbi:ATP-dependent DNA helicase [Lentilactobacillus senioris]|uniref:ATP-dependent DNA helicase n=1 Tax=Lentilactobacillus senioris TaxID=931534 RepID=UPI003D2BD021